MRLRLRSQSERVRQFCSSLWKSSQASRCTQHSKMANLRTSVPLTPHGNSVKVRSLQLRASYCQVRMGLKLLSAMLQMLHQMCIAIYVSEEYRPVVRTAGPSNTQPKQLLPCM